MDKEQLEFIQTIWVDLEFLNSNLEMMGFRKVRGSDDLFNTMKNGRSIANKKDRFISNLIQSLEYVNDHPTVEFAKRRSRMALRTFQLI